MAISHDKCKTTDMKIALIAEMEAAIVLPTTVTTKYHPYEFEVFKEEKNYGLR